MDFRFWKYPDMILFLIQSSAIFTALFFILALYPGRLLGGIGCLRHYEFPRESW